MEKRTFPRPCLDIFAYSDGSIKLRLVREGEQDREIATFKDKDSMLELFKIFEQLKPRHLRQMIEKVEQ